jgi:DNA repair exonuclease SbcCD nuclease subunit
MKIALLCDTHIGAKSDSRIFLEHQARFFSEMFFPTLEEHGVNVVLHLGDIFDRRKYINFYTLKRSKEFFFEELRTRNITMHAILGNHDTFHTTSNEINSVMLLLNEYDNIHVYGKEPVELEFSSTKIMMCPWLVKDTIAESMKKIKKSKAHILMGHFDIKGFEMMRGVVSDHGFDYKDFKHFEDVFSGHYHHPSQHNNIRYLGAQYEMTWSDYGSKRGFYLLDTETRELTFIENVNKIYHKIDYDDTDLTIDEISNLDVSSLANCYIKVIVKNRENPYLYDMFLNRLNDSGAADVKSVEDSLNLSDVGVEILLEEAKDTKEILHSYIDSVDTKISRKKIKNVVDLLYQEAISL